LHLRTVRLRRVRHIHTPTRRATHDLLPTTGWWRAARHGIPGGDDVGLYGVFGGVGGEAGGDGSFEELADTTVAVVAAGAQQQGTVGLHRGVAVGQRPRVGPGQATAGGVAVLEGEVAGAVVLLPRRHEREMHPGVVRVLVRAGVGVVHAVLQIGLHPRAATDTVV